MKTDILTFEIEREEDGGYVAVAETPDGHIYTQADSIEELKAEIRDAVETHFEDNRENMPATVRLVETEVMELVAA